MSNILMNILWKKKSKTLFVNGNTFVGNTRTNQIYISYFKPSFDF